MDAGRVLVVGDVVNDVLVRPLAPVTPDSDTTSEIVRRCGGSAANLACWLGRTGRRVTFVGRVGAGDRRLHHDELARFGVEARLVPDEERETGHIVILVDGDGRRTMYVDRGANLGLAPGDVPADALAGAALLHLTGYTFFEPALLPTALALLRDARGAGTRVSVDPSSVAFLRDAGPQRFVAWTAGADLCFPNRDEAAALTGTANPVAAAARLAEHYGTVVVTLDGEGAVVARRSEDPVVVPVERVVPVDPTGAGDAFCAGFLHHWLHDPAPVPAARAGAVVARDALTHLGGRPR